MSQTIEIVVSSRGETVLQTHGFPGASCREASRFLEQALGAKATDKPTHELYTVAEQQGVARQRS